MHVPGVMTEIDSVGSSRGPGTSVLINYPRGSHAGALGNATRHLYSLMLLESFQKMSCISKYLKANYLGAWDLP